MIERFKLSKGNTNYPPWMLEAMSRRHDELGAIFPCSYGMSNSNNNLCVNTRFGLIHTVYGDTIIKATDGEIGVIVK